MLINVLFLLDIRYVNLLNLITIFHYELIEFIGLGVEVLLCFFCLIILLIRFLQPFLFCLCYNITTKKLFVIFLNTN